MLLEAEHLSKHFGGIVALDELEFRMEEGTITGLIGPNGAGKTTFFNVATGVLPPTSGNVYFRGEETTGLKPYQICRKGIARTFQSPRPFTELTVEENLRLAKHFGPSDDDGVGVFEIDELLDMFDLAERRDDYPEELQFVQQKHLDLARALLTDPGLVLLDEIMSGLNPREKEELSDYIRSLHADHGIEFLVIEHDLNVIQQVCEDIVVIHKGQFLASGAPDEVMNDEAVREAYIS